jgi:predicted nucleotidyltransferase
MADILTLRDRKQAKIDALRGALPGIERALADYAALHGGRFFLFGSALTGRLHFESDIDVLVDFPRERLSAALDYAQALAAEKDVPLDAIGLSHCKAEFLERVLPHARLCA